MSVAIVGACLVSCFISVANPWFYTTKCGEDGCPACHKVAQRGRADVTTSAGRARDAFERNNKRSWWQRGCGWEKQKENEGATAEMQETTSTRGSFLGTVGVASHSDPYQSTRPMEINPVGNRADSATTTTGPGISFGVEVSYPTPESDQVALAGVNNDNETERDGGRTVSPSVIQGKETEQTTTTSISEAASQRPLAARPVLDEAISWDRIAGVNKSEGKRKWWYMP